LSLVKQVESVASLTANEAASLAELAAAILNPLEVCPRVQVHHPCATGALVHTANAPYVLNGVWNSYVSNGIIQANNVQGSFAMSTNRGLRQLVSTMASQDTIPLQSGLVDSILAIPPTAAINRTWSATTGAPVIVYNVSGPTVFANGILRDQTGNSSIVQVPALSSAPSDPSCMYLIGMNNTTPAWTNLQPQVFCYIQGQTCTVIGRLWLATNSGAQTNYTWSKSAWQTNVIFSAGPAIVIPFTDSVFNVLTTANGVVAAAFEFSSTQGTDCFAQLVFNMQPVDYSSPSTGQSALTLRPCMYTCNVQTVSWWNDNQDVFNGQCCVANQLTMTYAAAGLNDQGQVAIGVPPFGMAPGQMQGSNYFNAISLFSKNKYVGVAKSGCTALHCPKTMDRIVRADDISYGSDYLIMEMFNTIPTGTGGIASPSFMIRGDSLYTLTTTSPFLNPEPVPEVPHWQALVSAISASCFRCGDNGDHLETFKRQAASIAKWIISPEGKHHIKQGVELGTDLLKIVMSVIESFA
jgi:hypothetical protein